MGDTSQPQAQPQKFPLTLSVSQVNKEIVSGLKCLHHTYRHGLRGEGGVQGAVGGGLGGGQRAAPSVLIPPQWTKPSTWWAVTARAPRSMSS